MELIVEIFKKPSGLRNKDELFFIEHYLMTFENVMKILQQKTIGSAGNDLAKKIARYMQVDIVPQNTVICKLGDVGDKFYVIFQGNVAILIPKETNAKMDIDEYYKHLNKLFELGEYELTLKIIESNFHIYKNKDIIYLKSYVEQYLNIPSNSNVKRENLSIKEYMERIEFENFNENEENFNNIIIIGSPRRASLLLSEKEVNNIIDINRDNKNNVVNKSFGKKSTSLTAKRLLEIKKEPNVHKRSKKTSNDHLSLTKNPSHNSKFISNNIIWKPY